MEKTTRKVVTRSPARTVHILNLPGLLPAPVEAESSLERDFVYKAVLYSKLKDLRHQPFKLTLSEGKHYTPDFIAEVGNARCVVEVKLRSKVSKYRSVFGEASSVLRAHGFGFFVVTEQPLRVGRVHLRTADVLRYRKARYPLHECQRALDLVAARPSGIPLGRLIRHDGVRMEVVLHLMARRQLTTGPMVPLEAAALVFAVTNRKTGNEINDEIQFARWLGCSAWSPDA